MRRIADIRLDDSHRSRVRGERRVPAHQGQCAKSGSRLGLNDIAKRGAHRRRTGIHLHLVGESDRTAGVHVDVPGRYLEILDADSIGRRRARVNLRAARRDNRVLDRRSRIRVDSKAVVDLVVRKGALRQRDARRRRLQRRSAGHIHVGRGHAGALDIKIFTNTRLGGNRSRRRRRWHVADVHGRQIRGPASNDVRIARHYRVLDRRRRRCFNLEALVERVVGQRRPLRQAYGAAGGLEHHGIVSRQILDADVTGAGHGNLAANLGRASNRAAGIKLVDGHIRVAINCHVLARYLIQHKIIPRASV